jgi:putative PIN family toxin of toxin-antitoxin system
VRVVLDTNILVSACWKPGGLEDKMIKLAMDGRISIYVSQVVWSEYAEVLARPKFEKVRGKTVELLANLKTIVAWVSPVEELDVCPRDKDDNCLVECAVAAGALYLVTGNLGHFPTQYRSTQIVNARRFLESAGFGAG